jgi:hypothetical protein
MLVKDLIEKLSKEDPNAEVWMHYWTFFNEEYGQDFALARSVRANNDEFNVVYISEEN